MSKKGFVHNTVKKSMHQGPVITPGSGVSQSSIPRTGYPPGNRNHATRYDKSTDHHSIDNHTNKG